MNLKELNEERDKLDLAYKVYETALEAYFQAKATYGEVLKAYLTESGEPELAKAI